MPSQQAVDKLLKEPAVIQTLRQWDKMSLYTEITCTTELERIIRVNKDKKLMSLDTETTGLDVITAKCLGYSFAFEPHVAYWVTIKIDPQLKLLKRLLKGKEEVVFFNAGYDLAIIGNYGLTVPEKVVVDMMIACFFRDVNNYKRNAGLKKQSKEILSLPTVELTEILGANNGGKVPKREDVDFTMLEPWQQRVYGCQDADITLMLREHKSIKAARESMPEIWDLEHQLIRILMRMYREGIGLNVEKCAEFDVVLAEACGKCSVDVAKVMREALLIVDDDVLVNSDNVNELLRLSSKKGINLGSFKQKQLLLFNVLKLPPTRRTGTGYSTDQIALAEIEGEHEVVRLLMRHSKLVSRRNMYTKKLPLLVNEATGRIHPSLWATGVKSGRMSCTNPPMQGISKDHAEDDPVQIREVFIPRGSDRSLTAADYSQIELRIAASLSQEMIWVDAYNAGDIDVHRMTASKIYHVPFDKVMGDQRDCAKTANFSILTGISAYSLSAKNRKTIPTQHDAQDLIDGWFEALPRLTEWTEEMKSLTRANQSMKTYFGRIRPFPEIRDPGVELVAKRVEQFKQRDWAAGMDYNELAEIARKSISAGFERKGLSHIIQGTAADIIKIAMVKVDKAIRKEKMPVAMTLQVHDELLFDHPTAVTNELHALLRETMTFKQIGPGWVPLPIDIGCGDNWAVAH